MALHALMVPEDLAVRRVAYRVMSGGHDVPVEKIRERHRRLWPIVADAVPLADAATFWDNSRHDGPRTVAQFSDGVVVGSPDWPAWAPASITGLWPGR